MQIIGSITTLSSLYRDSSKMEQFVELPQLQGPHYLLQLHLGGICLHCVSVCYMESAKYSQLSCRVAGTPGAIMALNLSPLASIYI